MRDARGYGLMIGGEQVPITPEEITYHYNGNVETISLADDSKFTLHHNPDPIKIEFELRMTASTETPYPLIHDDANRDWSFWKDYLEDFFKSGKVTDVIIDRGEIPSTVFDKVILTGFGLAERASEGDDFFFSLEFTEYREQRNQELTANTQHHLIELEYVRGWDKSWR